MQSRRAHLAAGKRLVDFPGGTVMGPNEDVLEVKCDVLCPSALGQVITEANAHKLTCKVRTIKQGLLQTMTQIRSPQIVQCVH